ncbi:MAG: hormogonium polysaccharide biosynthesis protein HpsA [Cyanobacteria bacterium SBLK]|nr:hormogonium polysaccharide biosynthesis protein HpsA [Cyanobacteria bacterium SBLK]
MSILKRLIKSFQALLRELLLVPSKLARWLTRRFFQPARRNDFRGHQAGFILPTVVMVILVVTLLTTTIVFRSFDRAKNASNVRVNQVILNAALPAIERAKRKIDAVFADPTLPQGTPTDTAITNAFNSTNYDLGDEVRLRLAVDISGNGNIDTDFGTGNNNVNPTDEEVITTAWRFPVDTDNNGLFDSFTLYGVYYRSPSSGAPRARSTVEARTPPQDDSATNQACATALGTSASLTGAEGWYKVSGTLKKGFYVYTTTVPILDKTANIFPISGNYSNGNLYENYQGNRGFSALEYQQDRSRIPLGNNAVVYEDDLELFVGATTLNLNGRIVANSNFNSGIFRNTGRIRLYQVSSDESCFYEAENGKIFVGGNVSHGQIGSNRGNMRGINVDLYEEGNDPSLVQAIDRTNESTDQTADDVAYNTQAYEERIDLLVRSAIANVATPPQAVTDEVNQRLSEPDNAKTAPELLEEEYISWFRKRTRRVTFREVPFGDSGTQGLTINDTVLTGINTNFLRPIDRWHYPVNPNTGQDMANTTELALRTNQLAATNPDELGASELQLGDRVLVGNNLPEKWFDPTTGDFSTDESQQLIANTSWTGSAVQRYRFSRVSTLDDLGDISRDGFWEKAAAKLPENSLDGYGGLRIVTGAGIYMPLNVDLARIANLGNLNDPNDDTVSRVIWPDAMPVIPYTANHLSADPTNYYNLPNVAPWLGETDSNSNTNPDILDDENGNPRPFLRMRASAVYHYTYDNDNFNEDTPAAPIACVSSFYDPTDTSTARNRAGLADVSGDLAWQTNAIASFAPPNTPLATGLVDNTRLNSNNGVTYALPRNVDTGLAGDPVLQYQAQLVYPNGRLVNPQLAKALDDLLGGVSNLSFADRAALDTALCALQILAQQGVNTTFGAIAPNENPTGRVIIPNGTIQEVAFLDTREVKAIEGNDNTCGGTGCANGDNNYDNQPIQFSRVLDKPDLTTPNAVNCTPADCISQYDLALELRQPLEVRVTAIDLDTLRRQAVTQPYTNGPDPEYLFPNGGIIYATRDDALPDASDRPADPAYNRDGTASGFTNLYEQELGSDKVSPTDFWLDPTRRPNGILLVNGRSLGRAGANNFSEEEKGLILVSNNPVYIKGNFNQHTGGSGEEFDEQLDTANWSNFYTRSAGANGAGFNENFACRANDSRLPNCNPGDEWRQATILSDTLTLLTSDYRFGFRSDGDFDLRNNQTDNLFRNLTASTLNPDPANTYIPVKSRNEIDKARRDNGFWDNTFATNGLSSNNNTGVFGTNTPYTDASYRNFNQEALGSTYFNNGSMPIQRRKDVPEYVMEICRKLPVSNCQPGDWILGYDRNGDNDLDDSFTEADINAGADINGDGILGDASATGTFREKDITSEQLLRITEYGVPSERVGSGTTARAPLQAIDQHYPRRVAFKRNYGNLEFINATNSPVPIPLGIGTNNLVAAFKYQRNAAGGVPDGDPRAGNGVVVPGVGNIAYNARPRSTVNPNQNNALWFRGSDETDGQMWNGIVNNDYTDPNRWLSFLNPAPAVGTKDAYIAGYFDERDDWLLPDIDFFINGTGTDQGDIANNLNNSDYRTNYLNEYERGITPTLANLVDLNNRNAPVDYSVCINNLGAGGGQNANTQSQELQPTSISTSDAGCNVDTAVDRFLDAGVYVTSDTLNVDGTTGSGLSLGDKTRNHKTFEDKTVTDNDSGRVLDILTYSLNNVTPIDVGDGLLAPTQVNFNYLGDAVNPITLTLEGDSDTMFIFRFDSNNPVLFENVRMVLKGVNPNHIFWVVRDNDGGGAGEGGIVFAGTNSLAGNFLGRSSDLNAIMFDTTGAIRATNGSLSTPTNTTIAGGRFLGFNGTGGTIAAQPLATFNTAAGGPELTFNAITTSHQPLLIPVLQLHAFDSNNAPSTINFNSNAGALRTSNWLQRAADTIANPDNGTFNFVMATGDSPARFRPNNPSVFEANGSLSNLVRTQENWYVTNAIKRPLSIRGSFIQLQRSAYGTAPHLQLLEPYRSINQNSTVSLFGYPQAYSLNGNRNNTYDPPDRQWGFDVGILSQLPDLFSQRFTLPPTDAPNEYYREVGRNDPWIETLLCGNITNANGGLVGGRAVNDDYRTTNCPE